MTAQIIFFSAIGLFLVILMRRATLLEKIWGFLLVAFRVVAKASVALLGTIRHRARSGSDGLRLPKLNVPRRSSARTNSGQQGGVGFWREEAMDEKPEIMTHYDEGEDMFKAGRLDEAEKFFLTAATRNPKDPKVYARLGLIYLTRKSYSDAIEALKVAVKLDKYNPSRHYNLALAYGGKNDNQRAIATIREAISLDPVAPKYRALLEQLLNKK